MFRSARLKLTAWYLLIIMVISLSFSGVIYRGWLNEVSRFERVQRMRFQRRLEGIILPDGRRITQNIPVADTELLNEAKLRLLTLLGLINGSILILAGGLGYFLAGKTLRPIQEMVEDQSRFVGDASHELRTPLASLKTAFEVWLKDKNKTVKDAENIIKESVTEVNRLTVLTNSLLLSINGRPTANDHDITRIRLNAILDESINRTKSLAKEKNIKIQQTNDNWTVLGDKEKLTELFVLLLDNAIKYGKKGGWVKISTKKTDNHIAITVEDNGQGIEEKDLPSVFDRFYRADSSRTKYNNGGFGLGLSIAKQIVEKHQGSIGVKSQPGQGSTFNVKLPRL